MNDLTKSNLNLNFDTLTEKIREIDKTYDEKKIKAAYDLAERSHKGALRKSGESYISHPIAVALILLDMRMDTDTIVSALLHDVVEDTDTTLEDLRSQFGQTVADLVDGVTKIEMVKLNASGSGAGEEEDTASIITAKEEQAAENIRKILVAMSRDIRVIIIKLADRLHNMRTLSPFNDEKRKRISRETMTFYAPIAHRLGIAHIKDEIENTALFYLDNFAYKEIEESLERHKQWREDFIEKITTRINERLSDMSPPPVVEGRIKGIYSLYRKMYMTGREISEIYDLYAVRIIVTSVVDCYNVLGVIHEMFRPLPMRFKDYIASPKVNGYQSLHSIVLGKEGFPFEVQIRTHEMHNTARYGVAAHWRYKLGITPNIASENETKFDFIRRLLEQQSTDDIEQLAEAVKYDLSAKEVYVFTPQGDVISLPQGATVVDFAYSIHTQVGNTMTGARIHGKNVSFDRTLETGDIVEIKTNDSRNHGPNRSWLDYAKTNEAKTKIRHWLKRERKDENIPSGRAYVESVLRREGIQADDEELTMLAANHRFHTLDDFYEAIGYGGVPTEKAALWIRDDLVRKSEGAQAAVSEVVGNAYSATVRIIALDRRGLLMEITTIITESHILIIGNHSEIMKNGNALISFTIEVEDEDQLTYLIGRINKIAGVISVERI